MSMTVTKSPPEYLREARVQAGYVSRGTAAMAVPFSPETIGRHERGDVELEPEDAVTYAECYGSPDILPRYCATCPVGRKIGRTATDRPLPLATLRVRRMIVDGQAVADRLEQIAFDGVIDQSEQEAFAEALEFLRKLEESISDIILLGVNGKGRPLVQQGTAKRGN